MFDIEIPGYVWTCGGVIMFASELRKWVNMFLDFAEFTITHEHECELEKEAKEVPESVKRMFS